MKLALELRLVEPDEATRRRARVIAWRLQRGELVRVEAGDPAWALALEHGFRVPPGAASGSWP